MKPTSIVRGALALAAVVLSATFLAAPAAAGNQGPGGGGGASDTKGYELQPPSGVHLCLATTGAGPGTDVHVTTHCNFHDNAQRWTAIRDGSYGYIKSNLGGCLRNNGYIYGAVVNGVCSGNAALWTRTRSGGWYNREFGQCLQGRYLSDGTSIVSLDDCDGGYLQNWHVNG